MTHLFRDLTYAVRGLRRSPLFTMVALMSIALGIGANTAIFTLVDEVLLRRLPVKQPDQLVLFTGLAQPLRQQLGRQHAVVSDVRGLSRQLRRLRRPPTRQPAGAEPGADAEDFFRAVRAAPDRNERRRRRPERARARRAGVGHLFSGAWRRRRDRPGDRTRRRQGARRRVRGRVELRLLAQPIRLRSADRRPPNNDQQLSVHDHRRLAAGVRRTRHRRRLAHPRAGDAEGPDDAQLGRPSTTGAADGSTCSAG